MPVYEYRCGGCGKKFEALILRPEQQPECPFCGGKEVTKLFSTFCAAGRDAGGGCSGCSSSSCATCGK